MYGMLCYGMCVYLDMALKYYCAAVDLVKSFSRAWYGIRRVTSRILAQPSKHQEKDHRKTEKEEEEEEDGDGDGEKVGMETVERLHRLAGTVLGDMYAEVCGNNNEKKSGSGSGSGSEVFGVVKAWISKT
jgi:hypothetical protein